MANTKIPSELVAINAISGTLIADNAITSVHIAENNITATQIAINAVTALQMADGTITSAKIADGTIVTADIADGQITTGKLADSSVTTGKIVAGTIASADIANNAILTQHIDDNQITADQIADNAVGVDQLAGITRGSVLTGNAAGNPSLLALGAANTLLQSDGTDLVFAPLQSGIDDNSNAVAITIDSSENVGIGTTNPDGQLHVRTTDTTGDIRLGGGNGANNHRIFISAHATAAYIDSYGGGAYNSLGIQASVLHLNSASGTGNVGIGTAAPAYPFDVYGTDDITMRIHRPSSALGLNDTCGIGFSQRGDTNTSTSDTRAAIVSTYNGSLHLCTEPGGNLNSNPADHAALSIVGTSQNVGIGTTSPDTNLHVKTGTAQNDAHGLFKIEQTSTAAATAATNSGLTLKNHHGTAQFMQWENEGIRLGSRILTNSGIGDLVLTAGADSEKIRIEAGGNVGIGVQQPNYKLEVNGTLGSGDITSSGNVVLDAAGHNYIELHSATANTRKWRFYNGQSWNPDALLIYDQDADSTALTIETGKLGINRGAGSLSHTLDVGGNIAISGTEIIDSSRNLTNIGTISSGAIAAPSIAVTGAVSGSTLAATNTSNATGLSFRTAYEFISGEGWCTAHGQYNYNDGTLFLNRDTSDSLRPVFHIGGYNNVSYHPDISYSAGDAGMVTLTKPNGTKSEGSTYAAKGLSNGGDYSNWIKDGSKTVFYDSDNVHEFHNRLNVRGNMHVNSDKVSNQYLHIWQAVGGDGGLLFGDATGGSRYNWQQVPSTGTRDMMFYSYTGGYHTVKFGASGGIRSLADGGTSSAFFLAGETTAAANGKVAMGLRDGMIQFRDPGDYYHKMWYYDGVNVSTNQGHGHFRVWGDSGNSAMNATSAEDTLRFSIDTVTGNIGTSDGATNIYNASDERLKENVTTLPSMLNKINALRPISYDWKYKDGETGIYGFIAQEVQEVDASLVFNSGDSGYRNDKTYGEDLELDGTIEDTLAINERKLFPMLVKALQEQQTIIDDLKSRIETLEG